MLIESKLTCRANGNVYELLLIRGVDDGAHVSPVQSAREDLPALPCRLYELERDADGTRSVVAVYPDAPVASSFYALGVFDGSDAPLDVREVEVNFRRVKWRSRANYRLHPDDCARIRCIDERVPDTLETRFETLLVISTPSHLILKCRITLPDSEHRGDVSVSAIADGHVMVSSDHTVLSETSAASPVEGGPRPYRLAFSIRVPRDLGDLLLVVSSTKTSEVLHVERQTRELRDAMQAHMDHMLYRHAELDPFYAEWFDNHRVTGFELKLERRHPVPSGPAFTVVIPLQQSTANHLDETVNSVMGQSYPRWKLLLVCPDHISEELGRALEHPGAEDGRIKAVPSDEADQMCRTQELAPAEGVGNYICFLDSGDTLEPNALYAYARTAVDNPDVDVIYCDEDRIAADSTLVQPFFKPDFDIDLLRNRNYLHHFLALRKELLALLNMDSLGFDKASRYDLALRAIEKTSRIRHVPSVLYHSRISGSAGTDPVSQPRPNSDEAQALRNHLQRMGVGATVSINERNAFTVVYDVPTERPLVSIIIPTKDNARILERCVRSILETSSYQNFEMLIIDNGSTEPEVNDVYAGITDERVTVIHHDAPFNFSEIINLGVRSTRGEYLLLLNNDTEVITENWIELLLGTCARKEVGAVGAKLLYPDDTIQHAGVNITGGPIHLFSHLPNGARCYQDFSETPRNLSAITGACMMTKRSVFDRVGGFDEELVVTFNDVDYCLKLRDAGLLVVYNPLVELYHYESISRGADEDRAGKTRSLREKAILLTRWPEPYVCDPYYTPSPRQGDPECAYYAF